MVKVHFCLIVAAACHNPEVPSSKSATRSSHPAPVHGVLLSQMWTLPFSMWALWGLAPVFSRSLWIKAVIPHHPGPKCHLQTCWGHPFCHHLGRWWCWAGWTLRLLYYQLDAVSLTLLKWIIFYMKNNVFTVSQKHLSSWILTCANCFALFQHIGLCSGCLCWGWEV